MDKWVCVSHWFAVYLNKLYCESPKKLDEFLLPSWLCVLRAWLGSGKIILRTGLRINFSPFHRWVEEWTPLVKFRAKQEKTQFNILSLFPKRSWSCVLVGSCATAGSLLSWTWRQWVQVKLQSYLLRMAGSGRKALISQVTNFSLTLLAKRSGLEILISASFLSKCVFGSFSENPAPRVIADNSLSLEVHLPVSLKYFMMKQISYAILKCDILLETPLS